MLRVFSILILLGCSLACSPARLETIRQFGLDARLARVEAHRFDRDVTPSLTSSTFGQTGRSADLPSHERFAHDNPSHRRFGLGDDGSPNAPAPPLMLSEFGGALDLGDGGGGAEAGDPDADWWLDRERRYLRRPPLASFWDTVERDIQHLPRDLWRDTKRVYTNPLNLVVLGTAYGGSLAMQQTGVDKSVEDHFDRGHRHFGGEWRDLFGAAGNPGTHFGLAGLWYLIGQQAGDDKTYEVGKTLFSALAINGVTVMLGQTATWDRGPNGEVGTFPSGHTSSSFVFASVMHEAYGHLVGVPLYGLATLVAAERIDSGEHYLSDVVMGGVLGLVVGHSVASGREPEFFGFKLTPYVSPQSGASGVAFIKTFK